MNGKKGGRATQAQGKIVLSQWLSVNLEIVKTLWVAFYIARKDVELSLTKLARQDSCQAELDCYMACGFVSPLCEPRTFPLARCRNGNRQSYRGK